MLSGMQTPRIPSWVDDCGSLWIAECLVGDMGVGQSGATLEMPVA